MVGSLDRLVAAGASKWRQLKLAKQFALAGGAFTLIAMALFGLLTTTIMTDTVIQQRGSATALFMERVLSPLMQGLTDDGHLNGSEVGAINALMESPSLTARFPYLDVWLRDGTLAYSNSNLIAGRTFDLPSAAEEAFAGETVVTFTDLDAPEHAVRGFRSDFIEVYFPIHRTGTETIVAIAELHEGTGTLEEVLLSVTIKSWVTVAITSIVVMAGLYGIVLEGSRTIERQKRTLSKRLQHSHALNARNRKLKEEAQQVSRSVTELTDQHLRTIGADLHDGPAQTISFVALKVEQVRLARTAEKRESALVAIETSLSSALDEIRDISRGLVLPDIASLTLGETIDYAVELHSRRAGIVVEVDNRVGPLRASSAVSTCVFRFVQEGLNNAFHHGLSEHQEVAASGEDGILRLAVTNQHRDGRTVSPKSGHGIGLMGLHARVQSIGGNIIFVQGQHETRLEMSLNLGESVHG